MIEHPLEEPGHGFLKESQKATTGKWLLWLGMLLVGFAGEAWCVLEQVLTVPLTSDPETAKTFAPLQTAARWYLVGAAAFGVLIVVALVRLVLLLAKLERNDS